MRAADHTPIGIEIRMHAPECTFAESCRTESSSLWPSFRGRFRSFFIVLSLILSPLLSADGDDIAPFEFTTKDTLNIGKESSADAKNCLDGLKWAGGRFKVQVAEPLAGRGDALIRFPSPVPSGDTSNDEVSLEWYQARNADGQPVRAPAVVVVHESGSSMTVGRLFARGLQQRTLHAFLIHLPYYGERRKERRRPDAANLVQVIRQAIADVRRARDAVAVLPEVDAGHISLQGTSLGGFVSTTTACLDHSYNSVFIMLAGADLYSVIRSGQKDSARVRNRLQEAGLSGDRLKKLLATIEPSRIAHRLDPGTTWLYSARHDQVVPPSSSALLAKKARLKDAHHIQMEANHYTGIVYLGFVLNHMERQIRDARR